MSYVIRCEAPLTGSVIYLGVDGHYTNNKRAAEPFSSPGQAQWELEDQEALDAECGRYFYREIVRA